MNADKRKSLIYTAAIQVLLFIILYFSLAWKTPDPPIPEYGIEIGLVEVPSLSSPIMAETVNNETQTEEENNESAQGEDSPTTNDENIEELPQEAVTTEEEDPVISEESIKQNQINPPKSEDSTDKKTETKGEETKKNEASSSTTESTAIDSRILYGSNQTSSEGASLEMIGWTWDEIPKPNDPTEETGIIVYEISIDDDGYVTSLKILTSTVSPQTERYYRKSVEVLTFSKTSGYKSTNEAKGKITFSIKRKK